KRLARLARELGIGELVRDAGSEQELRRALAGNEAGATWLAEFEKTKEPWFYVSYGTGVFYHHHRSWIDDPTLPIATIGSCSGRPESGQEIRPPHAAVVAERARTTETFRLRLPATLRAPFDDSLALSRTVFRFVEDHNFYIDHRYLTIFWNKVRDFG